MKKKLTVFVAVILALSLVVSCNKTKENESSSSSIDEMSKTPSVEEVVVSKLGVSSKKGTEFYIGQKREDVKKELGEPSDVIHVEESDRGPELYSDRYNTDIEFIYDKDELVRGIHVKSEGYHIIEGPNSDVAVLEKHPELLVETQEGKIVMSDNYYADTDDGKFKTITSEEQSEMITQNKTTYFTNIKIFPITEPGTSTEIEEDVVQGIDVCDAEYSISFLEN